MKGGIIDANECCALTRVGYIRSTACILGKGTESHLLEQLAIIAREKGIRLFRGEVLTEDKEMMKVFRHSGFKPAEEPDHGVGG